MNSAGRSVRQLSLSIHTLPTFTRLPGDVTLSRGKRLELVCAATGSPQPRVFWTVNGHRIAGTWAVLHLGRGQRMLSLGGGRDPGAIPVLVPPFGVPGVPACLVVRAYNQLVPKHAFWGVCTPQTVCRGRAAGAPCGGRQSPAPTAGPMSAMPRTAPVPSGPPPSSPSEVGTGRENGVPGQPPSSTILLPFPEAPIIQGDPSTYQVEHPGGDTLLDCDARGHPVPLVRWSKDGVPVVASGRLRQLQNGSLAIRATGVSGAWGLPVHFGELSWQSQALC